MALLHARSVTRLRGFLFSLTLLAGGQIVHAQDFEARPWDGFFNFGDDFEPTAMLPEESTYPDGDEVAYYSEESELGYASYEEPGRSSLDTLLNFFAPPDTTPAPAPRLLSSNHQCFTSRWVGSASSQTPERVSIRWNGFGYTNFWQISFGNGKLRVERENSPISGTWTCNRGYYPLDVVAPHAVCAASEPVCFANQRSAPYPLKFATRSQGVDLLTAWQSRVNTRVRLGIRETQLPQLTVRCSGTDSQLLQCVTHKCTQYLGRTAELAGPGAAGETSVGDNVINTPRGEYHVVDYQTLLLSCNPASGGYWMRNGTVLTEGAFAGRVSKVLTCPSDFSQTFLDELPSFTCRRNSCHSRGLRGNSAVEVRFGTTSDTATIRCRDQRNVIVGTNRLRELVDIDCATDNTNYNQKPVACVIPENNPLHVGVANVNECGPGTSNVAARWGSRQRRCRACRSGLSINSQSGHCLPPSSMDSTTACTNERAASNVQGKERNRWVRETGSAEQRAKWVCKRRSRSYGCCRGRCAIGYRGRWGVCWREGCACDSSSDPNRLYARSKLNSSGIWGCGNCERRESVTWTSDTALTSSCRDGWRRGRRLIRVLKTATLPTPTNEDRDGQRCFDCPQLSADQRPYYRARPVMNSDNSRCIYRVLTDSRHLR